MKRMGRLGAWGPVTGMFATLICLLPAPAQAQFAADAWVRPLVALPIGGFSGRDEGISAGTSFGFDGGASLTLGGLTLYGEYQEVAFDCDECAEAGLHDTALDRGWGAGVIVPLLSSRYGFRPWARAGVIAHHLRFRSAEESAYSSEALGWSVGMGAEARPLRWLRVEPTLLFRRYDADFGFAIDVPDRAVTVSYLAFGLALGVGL